MPLPYSIPFGFGADSPFARTLRQLLPPGVLWLFEADSILSKSILALSDEFARATGRALDLVEESDPRTATETLDEWERVLGLPDDTVTAVPTTTAGRRLAIVQKLIRQGGQNAAFYVALAAACGYSVTVHDDYGATLFRAGHGRSGSRCYGPAWAYTWRLDVSAPAGTALTHAELEAIINRAKPAHTTVIYNYL
jgi:uncharacterized protein YmfQ (DUF2313 family)